MSESFRSSLYQLSESFHCLSVTGGLLMNCKSSHQQRSLNAPSYHDPDVTFNTLAATAPIRNSCFCVAAAFILDPLSASYPSSQLQKPAVTAARLLPQLSLLTVSLSCCNWGYYSFQLSQSRCNSSLGALEQP
jgi:hypothetical protein